MRKPNTGEVIPINAMEPTKIELVAAYIRVSSDEQKLHGLSLQAQEQKLQEYADANNMKIVAWYRDEGVSGRKKIKNRPELQRMIHDAQKKMFTRIIFIKLDRFFRSVAEYHECMKAIDPVVWTATEEKYDLATAQGRMLVNMKLTVAEMEADQGGERISLVNDYKVSVGQWLTGTSPLGYKVGRNEINRPILVKDPEKQEMVEDMIQFFLTHQNKRKTIFYLAEKYNFQWYARSLSDWLKNTLIYGHYRGYDNFCEPYIDKETFDRIQSILARNIKQNPRHRVFIFGGLIVCPLCGRKMAAGTYKKTVRGTARMYKYYRCMYHTHHASCNFSKSISENVLHRRMFEKVDEIFNEVKLKKIEAQKKTTKKTKDTVDAINAEIDRLNFSWQKGMIRTVEQYEEQYSKLLKKLDNARSYSPDQEDIDFSHIESLLGQGWQDVYQALDEEHKRAFWRQFISKIELDPETKDITNIIFF